MKMRNYKCEACDHGVCFASTSGRPSRCLFFESIAGAVPRWVRAPDGAHFTVTYTLGGAEPPPLGKVPYGPGIKACEEWRANKCSNSKSSKSVRVCPVCRAVLG